MRPQFGIYRSFQPYFRNLLTGFEEGELISIPMVIIVVSADKEKAEYTEILRPNTVYIGVFSRISVKAVSQRI